MPKIARYDRFVDWYEEFGPALREVEIDVLERYLGPGPGRLGPFRPALRARR